MAAGNAINLPPGFELDQAPASSGLPAGFVLDKEGPPQRGSLESFGRGAALVGKGLVQGAVDLPLMVTDLPTRIKRSLGYETGPTASEAMHGAFNKLALPEAENTFERIAEKGGELGPGLVSGGAALGPRVATALKDVGRWAMGHALGPTLGAWKRGDAATAIETMLEKGINATQGGVKKLRGMIDDINAQIETAIQNSPATVDKAQAGKYMQDLLDKFKNQVNPNADMSAIRKAWDEFKSHPAWGGTDKMSLEAAQELKRGTYAQLRKKYGEQGAADIEAQKTLARGLKDEITAGAPEVGPLNLADSQLYRTLGIAERRANLESSGRSLLGLAPLTHSPVGFAAYLADKSALAKSLLGRAAYGGSGAAGAAIGAAGGAGAYDATGMALNAILGQPRDEQGLVPISGIGR